MTLPMSDELRLHFTSIDWWLLTLSVVCGAGYLLAGFYFNLTPAHQTYLPLAMALKGLAVSPLALIALRRATGWDQWLLGGALAFSSLGDVLLAMRGRFVYGLVAFLLAHLLYVPLFIRQWPPQPFRAAPWKLIVTGLVIVYAAVMLWWLLPLRDGLSAPVAIYLCVLTAMVSTATLADFETAWVTVGAILFLISDSLIALNKFKGLFGPVSSGLLIWATYYNAQYLIALGVLGELCRQADFAEFEPEDLAASDSVHSILR